MRAFVRSFALIAATAIAACAAPEEDDSSADGAEVNEASGPKLCAAVRGNGHYIITHFTSLARIIEHYGVVDGMAGGSSGSITTFFYESILKNPAMTSCGGATCTAAERAARVSLALKSLQGFGEGVAGSDEGVAVSNLASVFGRLQQGVKESGVAGLVATDTLVAAKRLTQVLMIPEVRAMVNPESLQMLSLTNLLQLRFNINEVTTSITTLGAFSVDDNRLFFRPGILNWDGLATIFGRVGDFYAGNAPAKPEGIAAWLDACASASVGKSWAEAAALSRPGGGTCGEAFASVSGAYLKAVSGSKAAPTRLSDRVGDPSSPVRKLLATSVLEGSAVAAYEKGRSEYLKGTVPAGSIPFDVSFDNVKFGYWGAEADLARVASDRKGFGDMKTKKMTSLGNATWKEVLTASPAEPGLSHFVKLKDGRYSAGGWSDLDPTLVLKNIGCERVVLVTRQADETPFATKIAKNLGMGEAEWKAIYDAGSGSSSKTLSLREADGVWCTNWNAFKDLEQLEMAKDASSAPLEIRGGWTGITTLSPYPNTTTRTGKAGCTPGISGGATFPR